MKHYITKYFLIVIDHMFKWKLINLALFITFYVDLMRPFATRYSVVNERVRGEIVMAGPKYDVEGKSQ